MIYLPKEQTIEKIIDAACALYDFFDRLTADRNSSPRAVASKLCADYTLTEGQAKFLDQTAQRAERAKGIVRYLENRFGLDNSGKFQDPQGLHKSIFVRRKVPQGLEAQSYGLGVGFVKPRWRVWDKALAFVTPFFYDQLDASTEKTIERLERGKLTNCANLAFFIPSLESYAKRVREGKLQVKMSPREILLHALYGDVDMSQARKLQASATRHELRHIFDYILGSDHRASPNMEDVHVPPYVEAGASMCDRGGYSFQGLGIDLNKIKEGMEWMANRRQTLIEAGHPDKEKFTKELEVIKRCQAEHLTDRKIFEEFRTAGIPRSELERISFLFNSLDPREVPGTIRELVEWYRHLDLAR